MRTRITHTLTLDAYDAVAYDHDAQVTRLSWDGMEDHARTAIERLHPGADIEISRCADRGGCGRTRVDRFTAESGWERTLDTHEEVVIDLAIWDALLEAGNEALELGQIVDD
jgi:hypothetical protein